MVTTEDKMIPPDAQRSMSKRAGSAVSEVKRSQAVYVSQPKAVSHFVEQAAAGALSYKRACGIADSARPRASRTPSVACEAAAFPEGV
jgi:hypothetical protein